MGTWAEGNFDNDGALDFVGGVMDGIVKKIEACFADEYASDLDEEGEAVIVPGVHLLALISEECNAAPPQLLVVTDWKTRFLTIFDEQIGDLGPEGSFERKRRAVIEATFNRLEERSRKFWDE